jgi:hypothetical protein
MFQDSLRTENQQAAELANENLGRVLGRGQLKMKCFSNIIEKRCGFFSTISGYAAGLIAS